MGGDEQLLPPTVPTVRPPTAEEEERVPAARHTSGQGSRRASPWYQSRPSRPGSGANVAAVKRLTSLVEPIVVMALGVVLGLVDQRATNTSGWLRVPALVAALILVAQAILTIEIRRRGHDEVVVEDEVVGESTDVVKVTVTNPGMAVYSASTMASAEPAGSPPVTKRDGQQVMYFVMGLAVWLGLATLANPNAPRDLLLMSLLASFLLFAEAYKQMRGSS